MNKIVKSFLIVLALSLGVSCATTTKQSPATMEDKKLVSSELLSAFIGEITGGIMKIFVNKYDLGESSNSKIETKAKECSVDILSKKLSQFSDDKFLESFHSLKDLHKAFEQETLKIAEDSGVLIGICFRTVFAEEIRKKQIMKEMKTIGL